MFHFVKVTRISCHSPDLPKSIVFFFLVLIFGGHESFLWGHWCPCFELLVTYALGFKARMDPFTCIFRHLYTTLSSDSPLVRHLLTKSVVLKPLNGCSLSRVFSLNLYNLIRLIGVNFKLTTCNWELKFVLCYKWCKHTPYKLRIDCQEKLNYSSYYLH